MIGSPDHPMLTFGLPPDRVAWGALFCAFIVLFTKRPRWSPKVQLLSLCVLTFGLSAGYFHFYLGGAPRIIDATAYLLEARSFAAGSFSFEVPEPVGSFRGRFLIHPANEPHRLAGIFPPGYPTVLALGVALGVPYLVGPLLGAGLVGVTYALTFTLTKRRRDALLAASLSAGCACLRYHTAETMSHGLAALLTALALLATFRLLDKSETKHALILGSALGLLIATRQLTGGLVLLGVMTGLVAAKRTAALPDLSWVALGLLPGLGLLVAHQHAITGDFFTSAQTRYYGLADGPGDCFGLGFGKGCAYEHADVVTKHGGGLGLKWMGLNTLHRLHFHLMDIAHFEPLVLVPLAMLYRARGRADVRTLGAILILVPAGYSLFYFAGSYPGAGARLLSELLPLWHVLLAWGLCRLRLARLGLALSFVGFSLHGAYSHQLLANRSFGPPGDKLDELPAMLANETKGAAPVVFLETAHEFNLAKLSNVRFFAARATGDSRERLLLERRGNPPGFLYTTRAGSPQLIPRPDSKEENASVFEAEFEYPPSALHDLWVHPEHVPQTCASRGRALAVHVEGDHPAILFDVGPLSADQAEVVVTGIDRRGKCVQVDSKRSGSTVCVEGASLRNLSHIDRIALTLPHP